MGSPFCGLGIMSPIIFSLGSTTSHLNLLTTLWTNVSIARRAYSFPGHIRGPPPNGTNVKGGKTFASSYLEGSNFSGSGKNSGLLFVVLTVQYTCMPTKTYSMNQACSSHGSWLHGIHNRLNTWASNTIHKFIWDTQVFDRLISWSYVSLWD